MASPHVAGVAALVRQAHPTWKRADCKAAIVNTANAGAGRRLLRSAVGGAGLVQPAGDADQVVAYDRRSDRRVA